jgi:DNA-binding response OmpR family regulator
MFFTLSTQRPEWRPTGSSASDHGGTEEIVTHHFPNPMSDERKSILIIDDDDALCSTLTVRLHGEGYIVDVARGGLEGAARAIRQTYDLVILDIMLPEHNGWDVCRDIRQAGIRTPILFLSARRGTADKVSGFRLGANDYVTKPFRADELVARIEVQLRRGPVGPIRTGHGMLEFGPFEVDLGRAHVTRDGKPVQLTRREFQLLRYLIERSDTSVSRAELLKKVWGRKRTGPTTRTLDVHIFHLREKLEFNPKYPEVILTVEGIGYRVVGPGGRPRSVQ